MKDPRIFLLVQRAHAALFRAADLALKRIGLTSTQQAVLFALVEKDGQPISQIADTLRLGRSSLTGLVDRMSARGFVRRREVANDGRRVDIFIEPAGRRAVDTTIAGTRRINAALLKPFTPVERAVIEKFLRHVTDNADEIVAAEAKAAFKEKVSP